MEGNCARTGVNDNLTGEENRCVMVGGWAADPIAT